MMMMMMMMNIIMIIIIMMMMIIIIIHISDVIHELYLKLRHWGLGAYQPIHLIMRANLGAAPPEEAISNFPRRWANWRSLLLETLLQDVHIKLNAWVGKLWGLKASASNNNNNNDSNDSNNFTSGMFGATLLLNCSGDSVIQFLGAKDGYGILIFVDSRGLFWSFGAIFEDLDPVLKIRSEFLKNWSKMQSRFHQWYCRSISNAMHQKYRPQSQTEVFHPWRGTGNLPLGSFPPLKGIGVSHP